MLAYLGLSVYLDVACGCVGEERYVPDFGAENGETTWKT
jgi:hypothetical protein